MWGVAVGAVAAAAMSWATFGWNRVEVRAGFRPERAFASEAVSLRVRVTNGKRFPLPLVRLHVWLPPGLHPVDRDGGTIRGFDRRVWIPGRAQVDLDLPVRARRRGEYWLDKVEIELSDPFELVPVRRTLRPETALLVMPEPRFAIPADVRRRLPFGVPAAASRMFEDRERFAGVRPYEPGDPLNRIHWKLTGHAGGLQTKLFEPTRSADVLLALDLAVGEPFWDAIYPTIAEDTIGWATFLARQAIESGWRVGMLANTHLTKGRGPLVVPPSSAPGQEAALFAAMARMPNEPTADLAPVLRETSRRLGDRATVVVLSPRPGHWLQEAMAHLRRRGIEVVHLSPLEAMAAGLGDTGNGGGGT